jgi:hypothetical protein
MKLLLKKLTISIAFVLLGAISVYAQVPQGFNFQAVARDASGQLLVEQNLGVKVSILKGSETGTVAYSETHAVTTDAMGLIKIIIGEGTAEADAFNTVNWGNDNYFVKLAVDVTGGTEYEDLGVTRLLSVPYALVAENVLNSTGGSMGLNIDIDTANPDTSFIVNLTGNEGPEDVAKAMQVFGNSSGKNRVFVAEAKEPETSTASQYAIIGDAGGPGTGSHIGVLASAVNHTATGGTRYGLYGQASSKAQTNLGVFGIGLGEGSGDIVLPGEEVPGEIPGSYTIGVEGWAKNNLNGNIGVRGYTYGASGARVNIGVGAEAATTASGTNIGVEAFSRGSSSENWAFNGIADGSSKNKGMILHAHGGTSNIGMEVNADTAAIFNGDVLINGNFIHNGSASGGGSSSVDSLIVETDAIVGRSSRLYSGFLSLKGENGSSASLSRTALQFGGTDTQGSGFVYDWIQRGSMQVADSAYVNGGRSSGMGGGYFYMDVNDNGNFYVPLDFGIQNVAEGGRSWFEMSSYAREQAGLGALFSINISNDPAGTDPNGESSQVTLNGDVSPNFQFGGQSWNNNDLAFMNIYGSTADGNGWYYSNMDLSVGADGTHEWGGISIKKTHVVNQTVEETINLDGASGNINISGTLTQSSDERLKKDIKTIDGALNKTLDLRGVSYTWKDDAENENPQIGVIAQELEEIFPELVRTDENGMKSVNYAQMTAILIEAVKELNTLVEDLKSENKVLTAKVEKQDQLEQRIAQIEKILSGSTVSKTQKNIISDK